ncbi:MAG: universal stress protein [Actinomycetes bacterium]|jgi:nucleotide-binding universal stress UspA family protein|nr:universal stress protein [Actinomycetes bacterium]
MKRTLLIPTGFDEYAPRLMEFCAGTHRRGIIKCILLHVIDTSGMEYPVIADAVREADELLNELATPMRAEHIEVITRVETGNLTHQILRAAEQDDVDVLVMGTTRKTPMQRFFGGSVSAAITWGQSTPNLLVRDDILMGHSDVKQLSLDWSKTLVVPVDYSASSARAVLQCTKFESNAVGQVRLLHVIDPKHGNEGQLEAARTENTFRLSAFAAMLEQSGLNAVPVVRVGKPVEEILAEIDEAPGTGVVIGGGSKTSLSSWMLGSTARETILQAPVPVMVVP